VVAVVRKWEDLGRWVIRRTGEESSMCLKLGGGLLAPTKLHWSDGAQTYFRLLFLRPVNRPFGLVHPNAVME